MECKQIVLCSVARFSSEPMKIKLVHAMATVENRNKGIAEFMVQWRSRTHSMPIVPKARYARRCNKNSRYFLIFLIFFRMSGAENAIVVAIDLFYWIKEDSTGNGHSTLSAIFDMSVRRAFTTKFKSVNRSIIMTSQGAIFWFLLLKCDVGRQIWKF